MCRSLFQCKFEVQVVELMFHQPYELCRLILLLLIINDDNNDDNDTNNNNNKDQMYALMLIGLALSPRPVDESLEKTIRDLGSSTSQNSSNSSNSGKRSNSNNNSNNNSNSGEDDPGDPPAPLGSAPPSFVWTDRMDGWMDTCMYACMHGCSVFACMDVCRCDRPWAVSSPRAPAPVSLAIAGAFVRPGFQASAEPIRI